MARKVFYSFHYIPDCWRAAQVRNMGVIEGNEPTSDNDWEAISNAGDASIERWINSQLLGRTCTIVLVGHETAGRKWINYEIEKSWKLGLGLLGINIHNLKDFMQRQSPRGNNPFEHFNFGDRKFSSVVKLYDPPSIFSADVYAYIKSNISDWIEEAINIRANY